MQIDEPSEIVVKAWSRLVRAATTALATIEQDLKAAGLPPPSWYNLLVELRRAGDDGLRPFELEGSLQLAQPNVSRLIDRLNKRRLVERRPCADDGRGQVVVIAPAGLELLDRMWPVYRAAIGRHVGARLSEAKAGKLHRVLSKLAETRAKSS